MITLSASGGSVTFTFSGNSTYLNDGTIEVPVNSLALIIDESDMATFRKAASNDIFVSANIAEFGMTKDELMAWYKENMVGSSGGGGGVTPEEVEEMIDEAVSGKADINDVYTKTEVDDALSGKVNTSDFNTYSGAVDTILSGKQDTLVSGTNIKTINNESILGSGNIDIQGGGGVTPEEFEAYSASTDSRLSENEEVTSAALNAINDRLAEDEEVTAAALNELNEALSGKADSSDVYTKTEVDDALSGKVDTSAITSSITSGSTDIVTSGGVYDALGGMKIVKLTESEYQALVDKDPNVLYVVIPDPTNP